MRIEVLMADQAEAGYRAAHGLSLFIQAGGRRILFDAGPDGGFADNARALGIDLTRLDAVVLSHGHDDHGGGLARLRAIHPTVPIYLRPGATAPHAARRAGGRLDCLALPAACRRLPGLRLTAAEQAIGPGLILFSIPLAAPPPDSPMRAAGDTPDDFAHEQHLLILDEGGPVLVTGCAHQGILAILARARALAGGPLGAAVGGFHLASPRERLRDPEALTALAETLAAQPTHYITGHCTAPAAYAALAETLAGRIHPLRAGAGIIIEGGNIHAENRSRL
ncbi:MAG: MBL fold metallo-hydrolase [Christensenellales bacterium]|jgi:7,8-dihydropterin-6-yl-methyl-4-(beta-D-ribofuranosyl)aminobenzene 5'-phosphate synthase